MKKTLSLIATLLFLNGCAESVALLGTASSGAFGGGNVMQSAISSAASYGIKQQTGKSPTEHVIGYVKKNNPQNKKEKCIKFLEATNSEICSAVKKDILKTKEKILKSSKIKDLTSKKSQKNK